MQYIKKWKDKSSFFFENFSNSNNRLKHFFFKELNHFKFFKKLKSLQDDKTDFKIEVFSLQRSFSKFEDK